jgi:hypothetical protein
MIRNCSALMIFGTIVSFVFFAGTAAAYALPGTAASQTGSTYATSSFYYGGWNSASWQGLSAPFLNFTRSLQSVNGTSLNFVVSTTSVPNFSDTATQAAHGAFEQFDGWLAGIIGFHVSQILVVFLQLMSWILGLVKGTIDWMLSWIR